MASDALQPLTCQELVELVTEYLEDALSTVDRDRFDEHVALCPMCKTHLAQLRVTVRELGELEERDVDPGVLAEMQALFRDWHRGS
jgi:anti-sigma factor RsiW